MAAKELQSVLGGKRGGVEGNSNDVEHDGLGCDINPDIGQWFARKDIAE